MTIATSFLLAFVDCVPFLFIEHMTNVCETRMAEIFVGAAVFFTIQINKSLSLYLRGYFQKGNACI